MLADALTHSMNAAIKPARIQTDTAIVLQIVGAAITGNRCGLLQRQRVRTQDHRVAQRPTSLFHSGLAGPRLWLAPCRERPRPHLCHTCDSAKRASSEAYGACMSGTRQWAAHYGGCEESGPAPASVVGVLYFHIAFVLLCHQPIRRRRAARSALSPASQLRLPSSSGVKPAAAWASTGFLGCTSALGTSSQGGDTGPAGCGGRSPCLL